MNNLSEYRHMIFTAKTTFVIKNVSELEGHEIAAIFNMS